MSPFHFGLNNGIAGVWEYWPSAEAASIHAGHVAEELARNVAPTKLRGVVLRVRDGDGHEVSRRPLRGP